MSKETSRQASGKRNNRHLIGWCLLAVLLLILIVAIVLLSCRQVQQYSSSVGTTQSGPQVAQPGGTAKAPGTSTSATGTPVFSQPTTYKDLEVTICLVPRSEQIIRHTGYIVSYNAAWRIPNWVGYELTREETQGSEERGERFVADPLAQGAKATNNDYLRSGYDKGHMAPAADMKWSPEVMLQSFYLSNVCPQHPDLNRRRWKDLEEKIRNWAIADSAIVIVCGPIVEEPAATIGKNKVVVPQRFFKVVLSPYVSTPRAIGFLFSNERSVDALSTYVVPVDSIEKLTGLDFFAPLPDEIEDAVEASADYRSWGL